MQYPETSLKNEETNIITNYPVLKSFLAGSFSGTVSTILFQPLDVLKTRLQNPVYQQAGPSRSKIISTIFTIIQNEKFFGLWRGITPSMTRVIPGVGCYFSSLHWLKTSLDLSDPISPVQAITLGITARTITGTLLIPITVIKTRYESGVYQYSSIGEAFRLIHKHEGVKGLSSGLVPTLLRDAPYSGVYLMFYTQLKKFTYNKFSFVSNFSIIHFSCGVIAGIFASIITHPADVVKTKMQLYPKEFKGFKNSFTLIYYKYGISGFFKGIVPRMLRRTLVTAMAWTIYEQTAEVMGLK